MVKFEKQGEIKAALNAFDVNSWVLLGYTNDSTLVYQSEGKGGLDELINYLHDDQVQFFLLRLRAPKDTGGQDLTTRDVLVTWLGPGVSKIKKAKKKADQGDVYQVLSPNHAQIDCYNKAKLNAEEVLLKSDPSAGSHIIE